MFWKTLRRVIVVAFAFVASALVAIAVFLTLGLEHLIQRFNGARDELADPTLLLDFFAQAIAFLPAVTLIPALTVVIIGEVAHIRSFLYYLTAGGAALIAIPLLARFGTLAPAATAPEALVWTIFATAGFAAGALYWLIAGRNA